MPSNNSKDRASLCNFTFADGRQCRMLRHSKKSRYCYDHERKLRYLREADKTAADLCEPFSGDFVPATALTHSLTRVYRAAAEGRLDSKSASALARVASALLRSIRESNNEFKSCYRLGYWMQLVREHYTDMPEYIPKNLIPPQHRPQPRPTPTASTDSPSPDS